MEPTDRGKPFRDRWIDYIQQLQSTICTTLEALDGRARFESDQWEREEQGGERGEGGQGGVGGEGGERGEGGEGGGRGGEGEGGGGGGLTKVIARGDVFEKGGVNTSVVWGKVTDAMRSQLKIEGYRWFACGLSLVIHPVNPYVPTTHANWRYFELYDKDGNVVDRWFGGGSDLTPYYLFEEDARHFHRTFRSAMDPFGKENYPLFKQYCDEYFVNKHRGSETRGIGGVFYDHLRPADETDAERLFAFQQAGGNAFLPAYVPIVERRKGLAYGEREVEWQEIRRGRYVEFNLIHDRGTLFGLKTHGRTESILMSLPPRARWSYNFQPAGGSPEALLLDACLHPRDWAGDGDWTREE